ncbi:ferritin-like domain-containing protein, partial [Candidatus Bathyarchaeota archaeon]|nr:ferritin-like domain-containing protein [Candidatus Bathyarchaeota archaeon]
MALSAAVSCVFAVPTPQKDGGPEDDHGDKDLEPTGTVKEDDSPDDYQDDHSGDCDATPTEEPYEDTYEPEDDDYLESLPLPTGYPPPAPYVVEHHNVTEHGPYDGPDPTIVGALSTDVLADEMPVLPPAEDAYDYPADGELHGDQPVPYAPSGGIGTNGTEPVYRVQSDFDYQSLALALYQEWIELDLFYWGLATYSEEDFEAEGLTAEDRHLLQFMADQEIGHATVVSSMLGPQAPKQCTYNYPVANLREYIDFSQKLTRWGESGVYGFLPHLNSGP